MSSLNHVHTYVRAIGRKTKANADNRLMGFYKCKHPQCMHLIKSELILGKQSICNDCGQEFTLPLVLRLLGNRPRCRPCKKKKKIVIDNTASILDEIMS